MDRGGQEVGRRVGSEIREGLRISWEMGEVKQLYILLYNYVSG